MPEEVDIAGGVTHPNIGKLMGIDVVRNSERNLSPSLSVKAGVEGVSFFPVRGLHARVAVLRTISSETVSKNEGISSNRGTEVEAGNLLVIIKLTNTVAVEVVEGGFLSGIIAVKDRLRGQIPLHIPRAAIKGKIVAIILSRNIFLSKLRKIGGQTSGVHRKSAKAKNEHGNNGKCENKLFHVIHSLKYYGYKPLNKV
jgi:hypothetical protein